MAFTQTRNLNTFGLAVLEGIDKNPIDVITPQHPLWRRLKSKGGIKREAPGKGPVRDVIYATPDRTQMISMSQDMQEKQHTPIEGVTQAQYKWIQVIDDLTIPQMELDNAQGPKAVTSIITRKKQQLDESFQSKINSILWDGVTVGTDPVFGINDAIRFAPANESTRGPIGGIDATTYTWWRNKYVDYDAACVTAVSGLRTKSMISDPANETVTLSALWRDVTDNKDGNIAKGLPDLMPCNEVFIEQFDNLIQERIVFVNTKDTYDLGIDSYYWKGAAVFWDSSVPAAPTSGEGVCLMLNTNCFDVVFAEGLESSWKPEVMSKTGYAWSRRTQLSIAYNALGRMGVFFGSKDPAAS